MIVSLVTSPHVRHPAVLASDFNPGPELMYGFAPVGLLSVAAAVREAGVGEPNLVDLNRGINSGLVALDAEFYRSAARLVLRDAPDIVGFMTECDSYHHVLQICEEIRIASPSTRVVLGGPHASTVAAATLQRFKCVDAIVIGEGEISFPELLESWRSGSEGQTTGVYTRTGYEGPRPLVPELDDLPPPAYDLYRADEGEEIFLEVGRGCPFACSFCSTAPYWNRRHRVKSANRVLAEIRRVKERFGGERVHFTHDLLTVDRSWLMGLCDELVQSECGMKWTCSARVDRVDSQLLKRMADAGCSAIYFGLESGAPEMLESIHKSIPRERSLEVLEECVSLGIQPNAGFILGMPGETTATASATLDMYAAALERGCDPTHIFAFCPFPGAPVFSELTDLRCSGHYIDIPLPQKLDSHNRGLVEGDSELFSAYFRPPVDLPTGMLEACDEFTPLVQVASLPALLLAAASGGMFSLLEFWCEWIERRNRERGVAIHRRWYGRPVDFCDFLHAHNAAVNNGSPGLSAVITVLRQSLCLSETAALPTAMATHRSLVWPSLSESTGSYVADTVVAKMSVNFNIAPHLRWRPGSALPPEPEPGLTHLVWNQRDDDGRLSLVSVDSLLFDILAILEERRSLATTIVELDSSSNDAWDGDLRELEAAISRGINSGLVRAEP